MGGYENNPNIFHINFDKYKNLTIFISSNKNKKMKNYRTVSGELVTEREYIKMYEQVYSLIDETTLRCTYARVIDEKGPKTDMRFVSKASKLEASEKSLEFIITYLACNELNAAEYVLVQDKSTVVKLSDVPRGACFIFKGGNRCYVVECVEPTAITVLADGKKRLVLNTPTTLKRSVIIQ